MQHILPNDSYNHIQDVACGCNPTVVVSEGEEMYIHREIVDVIPLNNYKEIKEFFEKLDDE